MLGHGIKLIPPPDEYHIYPTPVSLDPYVGHYEQPRTYDRTEADAVLDLWNSYSTSASHGLRKKQPWLLKEPLQDSPGSRQVYLIAWFCL
jgi:hypothetical protein